MKNTLKILVLLLVALALAGCFSAVRIESDHLGRVVDATTGEPIEGVVVMGVWQTYELTPAGSNHTFYDARETVTDAKGEFRLNGLSPRIVSNVLPMDFYVFKAGYEYHYGGWDIHDDPMSLRKYIRWEGDRMVISLKKLTMEERKRQSNPGPPSKAPFEKVKLMLKEIKKDDIERGLKPNIRYWDGGSY